MGQFFVFRVFMIVCSIESYFCIYDPTKTTIYSGVKTVPSSPNQNILVHQNYSKVLHHNQNYQNYHNEDENNQQNQQIHPIYNGHTYGQTPQNSSTHQKITNTHINNNFGQSPANNENNNQQRKNIRIIITKKKKKEISKPIEVYSKCPSGSTGQFVYDLNCHQFLNCWKGRGYVQSCSPGTLFNPKTLECDFREKVECITGPRQNTLRREAISSSSQQVEQVTCPEGFTGLIPNYQNCSKFINCNNGQPRSMDCPPGTLFDINKNICDHAEKCTCFNGQTQQYQNKDNNNGGHYQQSQYEGHSHGYHQQSGQWQNQKPVVESSYYQPQQQHYQHGDNGQRYTSTNQKVYQTTYTQNIDSKLDFGSSESGCHGNNQQNCRQAHSFNPQHQSQKGCNPNVQNCNTNFVTNTGYSNCPNNDPNCRTSRVINQYQSQNVGSKPNYHTVCDQFGRNCRQTSGSQVGQQGNYNYNTNNKGQVRCPDGVQGVHPHPSDCAKFLNCANGITHVQDCAPGTLFNPAISVCDFPYNVKCSDPPATSRYEEDEDDGYTTPFSPNIGYQQQTNYPKGQYHQQGQQNQNYDSQNGNYNWQGSNTVNRGQQNQGTNIVHSQYTRSTTPRTSGNYGGLDHNQNINGQVDFGNEYNQNRDQNNEGTIIQSQYTRGTTPRTSGNYGGLDHSQNINGQVDFGNEYNQNQLGQNNGVRIHTQYGKSTERSTQVNYNSKNENINTKPNRINDNIDQSIYNQNQDDTFFTTPKSRHHNHQGQSQLEDVDQSYATDYDDTVNTNRDQQTGNRYVTLVRSTTPRNLDQESQWPPKFPSTDVNADYVFEYDDDVIVDLEADGSYAQKDNIDKKKKNKFECGKGDFHCSPKKCITKILACNGVKDCPDGEDEYDCDSFTERFKIYNGSKLAVVQKQRWDNITCETCAMLCLDSEHFECKSFNYRKMDKSCFLSDTNIGQTGALIYYSPFDYYERKSYQMDCTNLHKCPNKKCIQKKQICDGYDDCGDRSDEKGCSAKDFGYEIKLAGSKKENEGRIEVTAFGKTGYICDDQFAMMNAQVVCKELGFTEGALEVRGNSYFAQNMKENKTFYMMDDVYCVGNETSIRDCDFSGWGIHNCQNQEIVGVVCKTKLQKCPKDHWKCDTNNECIHLKFVCDGLYDCDDNSDEGSQHCEAPTEMRLANGSNKFEGRIEIKHHGTWGTVCDDDFNEDAAKVVCRYLGYTGTSTVKKDGFFGPGDGPIWLDQVSCFGNETDLEDCTHWGWGDHNCDHSEDVGVICSNNHYEYVEKHLKNNVTPPPASVYPKTCGYRKDNQFALDDGVHFRVVGGSRAKVGDYPWQAALKVRSKINAAHWCGAVVISEKFILTAAHCLIGYSKEAYVVVVGDYNVDDYEGTEQEAFIEDYYIHENFREGHKMNNDIALVKLKGKGFRLNLDVQPICLPDEDVDYDSKKNCTISGFGAEQSGQSTYSHQLKAGWVPILPSSVCKMPHVYGSALTEGMICAGSIDGGVDSCDGDSGGPLACLHEGQFTLFGLTSWGQRCGFANKPGVYVKVAHYRSWIDHILKNYS